ncbi:MAG: hypothetical protein ACKV2T_31835 [Kofleriaceae bacterium]
MALPSIALDEIRFDELIVALRRRIPAASNGRWTHHEPIDPGITLLELFSWQLEQRSYWLDRVTEPFARAIVSLLGETIALARAAATVLGFGPEPWTVLPAASVVRLDIRTVGPKFTIADATTLAPIERVGFIAFGRDRTADLEAGRSFRIFAADGKPGEAKLVLWLSAPPPALTAPVSVLVDLLGPPDLLPRWSPLLAGPVAPPAAIEFRYRSTANRDVALAVDDGTGGLRRSGLWRFVPPIDWQPDGPPVDGLTPYALSIRTAHATFTAPPRISRIVPNAVAAQHRRAAQHFLSADWLPLASTTLPLPVLEAPPIAESIALSIDEVAHGVQAWRATPSLAFHGPADRVFELDRVASRVRFGDGLTGRVPRPQSLSIPNVFIDYEVGGGEGGNLGSGLGWIVESNGLAAANVVDAAGGSEPERVDAALERMASAVRRVTRAITAEDYEELALTTPGIAVRRAHAAVGYSSLTPCIPVPGMVTVFVVPFAPREEPNDFVESAFVVAPQPDPGALLEMRARLDVARLVTHEVCVRGPLYRNVWLRIDVSADAGEPAELRRTVAVRVARFLDPLVGGDTGDGWPFGETLRQSSLLRVAQNAIATDGRVTRVAISLDNCTFDDCHEVAIGAHALVGEVVIDVRVQPQPMAKGALR